MERVHDLGLSTEEKTPSLTLPRFAGEGIEGIA